LISWGFTLGGLEDVDGLDLEFRRDLRIMALREKGCMVHSGVSVLCKWVGGREQQDIVKAGVD